ncbi:MAG: hypothetical protein IJW06_00225 [Clostridia bacterium]|nr:hypothetical protein [Clostridia bacterium]
MFSMKKIAVLFAAVLMTVSFCSCTANKEKNDGAGKVPSKQDADKVENVTSPEKDTDKAGADTLTKKEVDALAAVALEKLSVIPEYPAGYPTLDDVVSQYKKATEAIGWIVGTELVATDADYTYQAYDMKYYKVLPDCYLGTKAAGKNPDAEMLIYNKKTFEAYLATLISADEASDYILDITDSFEIPRFVESKNGELYALPYAFPAAGYGEEDTYELKANDDGSYTLSVTYDILDENDEVERQGVYNVKYVQKDGRWVFENFRVVKQH